MNYLKITFENITHKFTSIPQSFEALDQLIQKSFQKSLSNYTLFFQETSVTTSDDYKFLIQQQKNIKLSLRLNSQPKTFRSRSSFKKQKNQLYYLTFDEQNTFNMVNDKTKMQRFPLSTSFSYVEKPKKCCRETFSIPQKKIKNSIQYKGQFTEYSETVLNILPGGSKLLNLSVINSGCESFPEQTFLYSTSGITMGQTYQISELGAKEMKNFQIPIRMPNQSGEYYSVWRLMTYQNGVRKCFGPKIQVLVRSEMDIDGQVGKMLQKAQEVKQVLGGQVINYVRFIRENRLQHESVKFIVERIVQDPEF